MRLRPPAFFTFVVTFSLLLLFFSQTSAAQSAATLRGVLSDPAGQPIRGAIVSAIPESAGATSRQQASQTASLADGTFELILSPGGYRVVITRASFARVERTIDLAAAQHLDLPVTMALEPLASSVVVTAEAAPAEANTSPAPLTTVTRAQIDQRAVDSLPDLLATLPGISFDRTGPEGGETSLFLDGGNSNYTKVLIDGTPANDSGGPVDFSNFTLDNVDKIEVVHGAESAIYGSDAMTGVIQIFTHRGETREPELDLTGEGGSFDTGRGSAVLSGLLGPFDYSVAEGYFTTAGQGPNDAFLNRTLSGSFGWKFPDGNSLRFTVRDNSSDAGIPGPTLYLPPDLGQTNALHNLYANAVWNVQHGKHWQWRVSGDESSLHGVDNDPGNFVSTDQFNRAALNAQATYLFLKGAFTGGYYYEVENGYPGALEGEHARRNNQAGYVDARWQPIPRLTLNAGARAEDNSSFGTRVVPRAGAAYLLRRGNSNWGAARAHAFYGQGIDEPELAESFGTDPCFPGNPNLQPEESKTASAGIEQRLASDRVRVSADYFYNEFHNVISFAFLLPTPTCQFGTGTYFNTDLAIARGANLSLETRIVRWLTIAGHYSFDNSRVLISPNATDPTELPGNHLLRRPVNSGSVVLNAVWRRVDFNLVGYITGQRTDSDFLGLGFTRDPGYSRFDVATSYRVDRNVSLFVRAGNVLDRQYQDALGYPALGREVRGGVKLTFGGRN
ncbi:MAG TPA: TonB-dependent receptor [Candidatus Acidoferrales bacterium]|nr:TonB-dependent receptor [Candidatus Acidoferrales bacterium]